VSARGAGGASGCWGRDPEAPASATGAREDARSPREACHHPRPGGG